MVALLRPTVDPTGRQHALPTPPRGGLRLVVDNTVEPEVSPDSGLSPIAGLDRSLLMTSAIVALVVFGGLFALRLVQDVAPEGSAPAPVAAPGQGDGLEGVVVVAKPGDSLWSIAKTIAPDSDPRPVVAALVEANGSDSVQIGQQIVIPQQLLD